jgi:hypothetical protein
MKKNLMAIIIVTFSLSSFSQVKEDTVWTKTTIKDTSVSEQTKFVPVIIPHGHSDAVKINKLPNYIIGGSIIALSLTSLVVSIVSASGDKSFARGYPNYSLQSNCRFTINLSLSIAGTLTGVAVMLK